MFRLCIDSTCNRTTEFVFTGYHSVTMVSRFPGRSDGRLPFEGGSQSWMLSRYKRTGQRQRSTEAWTCQGSIEDHDTYAKRFWTTGSEGKSSLCPSPLSNVLAAIGSVEIYVDVAVGKGAASIESP